ncbi:MAG: hypothetical protein R2754_04065 [Microthrixaceae bacterium]
MRTKAIAISLVLGFAGADAACAGPLEPVPESTTTTTEAPGVNTVDANTASTDEIAEALRRHGVINTGRWSFEVERFRPYPTDDPKLATLRKDLSQYNVEPDVIDAIIGSLHV